MKKLLVKAGLMVGSLLIFGIAANAQTQYRAEIPFDFEVAGNVLTAGEYSVGNISPGGTALIIRNRKTGKSRMLGSANMGAPSWNGSTGKFVFIKADGRYTLSEVVTPSFAMKLRGTSTNVKM